MSQEQRNSMTPSEEPTTSTQRESGEVPVLSSIEERITQADNHGDAMDWARVHEVIIRQNEVSKNQEHQRFLEKVQVWYKIGLSVMAFVVGIGLLIGDLTLEGFFISGAGLFGIVPEYVKMFFRSFREKGKGRGGNNVEE